MSYASAGHNKHLNIACNMQLVQEFDKQYLLVIVDLTQFDFNDLAP